MKTEFANQNGPALSLDSLAEVCRHMAVAIGAEFGSTEKYFFSEGFPELDWHNRVILNEIKEDGQQTVEEAVRLAVNSGNPKFLTFCDELMTEEAMKRLDSLKLTPDQVLYGMVYQPIEEDRHFHDARVMRIFEDRIDEWDTVVNKVFEREDGYRAGRMLLKDRNIKFFAVEEAGHIVSTAMLCLDDRRENAGIHNVTTLPEFRRRGNAEALVRHMVAGALDHGSPLLSLQASEMGKLVYSKIGFETVSTIRMYK